MAKLIKAVFGAGETSKTCKQWQYDYNTILQFVGLDLPSTFEVDLANSKTGQSTTVLGDADGCCTIPAQYFIPGTSIFAWAYIVDSNSGYTRCQVEIPIHPRAKHTGDPPTPEQQSALDQAIAMLNAATANIPSEINAALEAAKESGEFDGKDGKDGEDGSGVWYTTARVLAGSGNPFVRRRDLIGREGATVQVNDLLFAPDVGYEGEPTTLYEVTSVGTACNLKRLCKMKGTDGEDGTSPGVTITEIEGGHRITITDEAHPDGQRFDVMDGTGGGVTVDDALSGSSTNPVQNKVVNAALDGKGTYSKPASGIPKTDMAEDVQTSLSKADTALQQHQSLAAYRTSQAQDEIDRQQNTAIAAKYTKPGTGIPYNDMSAEVRNRLDSAGIFYATYEVTTAEEIEAAYQAGKDVICVYYNYYLPLAYRSPDLNYPCYVFEGIAGNYDHYHEVMCATLRSTWYFENIDLNAYATYSDIDGYFFKPLVLLVVNNGSLVLNMAMGDQAPSFFINHGSQTLSRLIQAYEHGLHMEFYLSRAMLDGGAQDAVADFRIEALQRSASAGTITSLTLSTTVDGKFYWAVLTPVSETTMTGTLHSMDIPTKTSDLTNDSGFITAHGAAAAAPVQSVNGQTGSVVLSIPTVPSNVSSFTNDAGYLTQHQDISGKADKVTEVTVSTAGDVTQALDAGKVYHFTGALTALTLTLNSPAAGQQAQYHFDFVSGSAAPTVTIPSSVTMPDGFQVEADKRYEIDILGGFGVAQSWEVTA